MMPLHFYLVFCFLTYNHNVLIFVTWKSLWIKWVNAFKLIKCYLVVEKDFLDSLPLSQQCTEEEVELLRFLFENKLKKVRGPPFTLISSNHDRISKIFVYQRWFAMIYIWNSQHLQHHTDQTLLIIFPDFVLLFFSLKKNMHKLLWEFEVPVYSVSGVEVLTEVLISNSSLSV